MGLFRQLRDVGRFDEIVLVLFEEGFGHLMKDTELLDRVPFHKKLAQKLKPQEKNNIRIRRILERLGPTFIKLGQMLSLRQDLLPDELCEELSILQDNVKGFPCKEARNIIEKELNRPLDSIFAKFEEKPLAAASISQVHMACLKDGSKVAVKIRRPGIEKVMEEDIDIMDKIARLLSQREDLKNYNLPTIVEEFKRYTKNELDFRKEARNCVKFRKNFKDFKHIYFPKPYLEFSSKKVFVTELISGVEVSDIARLKRMNVNLNHIASLGTRAILKQVFEDRFFHADSHPGNMLVTGKNSIACIDFGIVGQLSEVEAEKLLLLAFAVVEENTNKALELILQISIPGNDPKPDLFRADAEELLNGWYGTSLKEERITSILYRLILLAAKYDIKVPPDVVLFGKALITMEGTALRLNPNFNFFKESNSYLKEIVAKKQSPIRKLAALEKKAQEAYFDVEKIPDRITKLIERLETGKFTFSLDDKSAKSLSKAAGMASAGNDKKTLSILIGSLVVSSAILIAAGKNEKVFNLDLARAELALAAVISWALLRQIFKKHEVD